MGDKSIKSKKTYKDFKFDLFGDKFNVHFTDAVHDVDDNDHWIFGNSNYSECEINLSTKSPLGHPLKPEQIKQTFIHECVHMMLESGQYYNESCNEALVEWMAKCVNVMFFSNSDIAKKF